MHEDLIGPKEVASKLAVHERTAIRLMSSGKIQSMRVGAKLWRTRPRFLTEYEQQQFVLAQQGPRTRMAMQTIACLRELERMGVLDEQGQQTLEDLESQVSAIDPNDRLLLRAA